MPDPAPTFGQRLQRLFLTGLLTLLPLFIARRQQVRNDWQQLLLLLATVTAAAL